MPIADGNHHTTDNNANSVISTPGSSLEDLGIHRNTQTTSPLHRPEEVVLMAPDGSLDASERTAE